MSVTSAQAISLLENVLYESASIAAQNAPAYVALSNGNATYSTVSGLASLFASFAEASITQQVVRYYEGALGRAPAGSEIAYYVGIAENGLTADQIGQGASAVSQGTWNIIANDFANSPEFKFNTNGGSVTSVIQALYTNILGRAPSATEVAFYQAQSSAGLGTNILVQEFVNSPEYQGNANTGIQSALATYGAAAVAAGLTPSQNTTQINNTVGPKATSYTLTTGVDNLVATTAGANTFVGVLDSTAGVATFGGADTITGLGSNNTLLLTDAVSSDADVIPVGSTVTNIQTVTLKTAGSAGNGGTGAVFNVAGISGVTALNVTTSSTTTVNAVAAGSAATITFSDVGGSGVITQGGSAVTVTENGTGTVKVGNLAAAGSSQLPSGAVTVTATTGTVDVDGGTSVTVSAKNAAINIDTAASSSGAVTVTQTGSTNAGAITIGTHTGVASTDIGAAGTVTVTDTNSLAAAGTGAAILVVGGTTDTITSNIAPSAAAVKAIVAGATNPGVVTGGNITVAGTAGTTTVTVTQTAAVAAASGSAAVGAVAVTAAVASAPGYAGKAASGGTAAVAATAGTFGIVDGTVTITDESTSANTITTVSLTNYNNSTFTGQALSTLNLTGTAGTFADNASAAVTSAATLALNLNSVAKATGLTDGITINANANVQTVKVTTSGTASKLSSLVDANLKTLTVGGSAGGLSVLLNAANDAALTSVTVSGAASFADQGVLAGSGLSSLGAALTVTTTSSGTFAATLDDTTQTFAGSTGADTITLSGNVTATKAITAGTATTNEVIFDVTAGTAGIVTNGAATAAKVTGFQIFGLEGGAATVDMSVIDATASTLDVRSVATTATAAAGVNGGAIAGGTLATETGAIVISKLAAGSAINLSTGTGDAEFLSAVTVGYADNHGPTDTVAITLGKGFELANNLTVQDLNSHGIGSLSIATTNSADLTIAKAIGGAVTTVAAYDQITTLTDKDLSTLTVTGDGLFINKLVSNNAGTMTIADTAKSGVEIGSLSDAYGLGSLTFTGTGKTWVDALNVSADVVTTVGNAVAVLGLANTSSATATIGTLTGSTAAGAASLGEVDFSGTSAIKVTTLVDNASASGITALTLNSTDSATVSVGAITSSNTLASLTLKGNINIGSVTPTLVAGVVTSVAPTGTITLSDTAGVTVAGSTDNGNVVLTLTGGLTTKTDTITLGNGFNYVVDNSQAGTVKVTLGTGSNVVDLHSGGLTDAGHTYNASVTLGTHSADLINVGTYNGATTLAANYVDTVITGSSAGDKIGVADVTGFVTLNAADQTSVNNAATLAAAVAFVDGTALTTAATGVGAGAGGALQAHYATAFSYGGNTYILETVANANGTLQYNAGAASDTLVELVGTHTISATTASLTAHQLLVG